MRIFLNRYSPSTNSQNSCGSSPEYSMMVLVPGDNFEVFLQFYLSKINKYVSFFLDVTHELIGNEVMFLHGS